MRTSLTPAFLFLVATLLTAQSVAGEAQPPTVSLGEAKAAPRIDGRVDDPAWNQAHTWSVDLREGGVAAVKAVVHGGGLFVAYSCPLPYQRVHSFTLIVRGDSSGSSAQRILWTPWSILSVPCQVEEQIRAADGAVSWEPVAGGAAGAAAFSTKGWSGGWSVELVLTGAVLEGATELRMAFEVRTEQDGVSVPRGFDLEDPATYAVIRSPQPLSPSRLLEASETLRALVIAETARNQELAELLRVVGMLNQIRDMNGLAAAYERMVERNPQSPDHRIALSAQLAAIGRIRESVEVARKLRESFRGYQGLPGDEIYAHSLLQAHLWERAREALAELPANNLRRRIDEAMLAYHLGEFAEGRRLTAALLADEDVPAEKVEQIQSFHDYCAEYDDGLLAAELQARREDQAGEPLPLAVLVLEGGVEIEVELLENDAPNTVANFIRLAEGGFYAGTRFHRILSTGLAQGGCPLTRNEILRDDGLGGPPYRIATELAPRPDGRRRRHFRGTLGMANTGEPNTEGSQFYLCVSTCAHLNDKHTVFGRVLSGQDHVDAISAATLLVSVEIRRKRSHAYDVSKIPLEGE